MTQLISDLVRKVGFNDVDAENDGHSALQRLRHKKYGLVLSDWEMQPMSGEEFLRAMRQDRAIGKIPIILITGTAGRGTAWPEATKWMAVSACVTGATASRSLAPPSC